MEHTQRSFGVGGFSPPEFMEHTHSDRLGLVEISSWCLADNRNGPTASTHHTALTCVRTADLRLKVLPDILAQAVAPGAIHLHWTPICCAGFPNRQHRVTFMTGQCHKSGFVVGSGAYTHATGGLHPNTATNLVTVEAHTEGCRAALRTSHSTDSCQTLEQESKAAQPMIIAHSSCHRSEHAHMGRRQPLDMLVCCACAIPLCPVGSETCPHQTSWVADKGFVAICDRHVAQRAADACSIKTPSARYINTATVGQTDAQAPFKDRAGLTGACC